MTRINVIPPKKLWIGHLIAEHYELPRVYDLVRKAIARGDEPNLNDPPTYRMGTGHVKFFYPRLYWLRTREILLIGEMNDRELPLRQPLQDITDIPDEWFGDWEPDDHAMLTSLARINESLEQNELRQMQGYVIERTDRYEDP